MQSTLLAAAGGAEGSSGSIFGTVQPPIGVSEFDAASVAAGGSNFGLILFISNVIKLGTLIAGLWVLFNIISAGLSYISAQGDSSVPDKAKDQIVHSVIGLGIIVFSYLIIALISFFFFGRADYILNPTITGPRGATP